MQKTSELITEIAPGLPGSHHLASESLYLRQPNGAETAMWWRRKQTWTPCDGAIPPDLQAWAEVVDVSLVSDTTAAMADEYLRMYRRMNWVARGEFGYRLVDVITAEVHPPPPSTLMPLDIAATVLTKRNKLHHTGGEREY